MSGPKVFRLQPVGPASAYSTYGFRRPAATHSRPATCEEVDCEPYMYGWTTRVPTGSALEATLRASGRPWLRATAEPDGVTAYLFAPGTPCFRAHEHRVQLDRPSLYFVRDGDWRGNPTGHVRRHVRAEDWVEDFATHTDQIADQIRRG